MDCWCRWNHSRTDQRTPCATFLVIQGGECFQKIASDMTLFAMIEPLIARGVLDHIHLFFEL